MALVALQWSSNMLEILSDDELFKTLEKIQEKKDSLPPSQIKGDTYLIMQEIYKRQGLEKWFNLLYEDYGNKKE